MGKEKAGYVNLESASILVIRIRPKIGISLCNQELSTDLLFFMTEIIFNSSLVLQSFVMDTPKYFTSFFTGIPYNHELKLTHIF